MNKPENNEQKIDASMIRNRVGECEREREREREGESEREVRSRVRDETSIQTKVKSS